MKRKILLSMIIGVVLALSITSAVAYAGALTSPISTGLTRSLGNTYSENYTYSQSGTAFEDVRVTYSKYTHAAKTRMDLYPNIAGYEGRQMRAYVELKNTKNKISSTQDIQTYSNNSNWALEANKSNSILYANVKIVHQASVYTVNGIYDFQFDITAQ